MRAKVIRAGEGYALVIDREVLARLGVGEGSELEVSVEHGRLVAESSRRMRIRVTAERIMLEHEQTLKRLQQS